MKFNSVKDIEAFRAAIDRCKGDVWIESKNGDKFNLKSMFSQYLAIGKLIEDYNEELELFAANPSDEFILIDFLNSRK